MREPFKLYRLGGMWSVFLIIALCGLPASLQQSAVGVPSVGPAAAAPTPAVLPGREDHRSGTTLQDNSTWSCRNVLSRLSDSVSKLRCCGPELWQLVLSHGCVLQARFQMAFANATTHTAQSVELMAKHTAMPASWHARMCRLPQRACAHHAIV